MTLGAIYEQMQEADMILVGLGEEFDAASALKKNEAYLAGRNDLERTEELWLLPLHNEMYRAQIERNKEIKVALEKLSQLLEGKNYFVVSTSMNDMIENIPWREGRIVRPCGGNLRKQCPDCCAEGLQDVTEQDRKAAEEYLRNLNSDNGAFVGGKENLGNCPTCGKPLVFNNIYVQRYDENGYLLQWQIYTKWLQGTLNRKVVILELGVGMKFPSVIRWPFEKIAFFNQKASFYRVNETLYQMSEELKEKGISIPKNAVDWLRGV